MLFLGRSGGRSHHAAGLATRAGCRAACNILEGFEGELDGERRRGTLGGWRRARGGSFTLPRRFVSAGFNSVTVSLQSNSGKTRDVIRLDLWAY